jgi:hypothetical protein
MRSTFFLRKRIPNPTSGNTVFVHGLVFDPGAEAWATESTVGDPIYSLRVFPQWNFQTFECLQPEMVFQTLTLPPQLPAGFPFGGVLSAGLMHENDYPDIAGDYWS